MWRFVVVVVSLTVCTFGASLSPFAPSIPDGRIVGGKPTTIDKIPWQVALSYLSSFTCGGVIVNEKYILTAGHCVVGRVSNYFQVRVNSTTYSSGGTVYNVKRILHHDLFTEHGEAADFDIGLLELTTTLKLGPGVQAIALAQQNEPIADGAQALISGWGKISETGPLSSTLLEVTVPVVNQEQCIQAFKAEGEEVTPRMFCAGVMEGGKDACNGDSGGPVVVGGKIVGVVSWGLGCARPGLPGVYTRIASMRDWWDKNAV